MSLHRVNVRFALLRFAPLACAALIGAPGCGGSAGKSLMVAKDLNPDEVAKRAIEQYDANKDGKVDGKELENCRALLSAIPRIDSNKDGSVTADEIAARFRQYQSQSDLLPLSVRLERDKSPLSDAEVVFEPEPFMGEGLPKFKGVSDASGAVLLTGEGVDLPGLPLGLYRVRITGPVDADIGCEVAEDTPTSGRFILSL